MDNYDVRLEKALQYLRTPSKTDARGASPIAYLTYQPEDAINFRDFIETYLQPKAEFYGFKVKYIFIGDIIDEYIKNHNFRDLWTDPSITENEMYNSIKQEMSKNNFFEDCFIEAQEKLKDEPDALLVIRDVELLHPFYMMGVIENKIYNKIKIPMLILYPGETQGTARSFLNVYNQDGNYRSINF